MFKTHPMYTRVADNILSHIQQPTLIFLQLETCRDSTIEYGKNRLTI